MASREQLIRWALNDAEETFREEQLEHWWHNVRSDEVPAPQSTWLRDWLGRSPREPERKEYSEAYMAALARAVRYVERMSGRLDEALAYSDVDDDVADDVWLDVIEGAVERLHRRPDQAV